MGVALSSLRVDLTSDTSGYVSAMAAKVAADNAAADSSTKLAGAIDSTSQRLNDGGLALARLSNQYIPGSRAASQFQNAVLQLGSQIDRGNVPLAQVQPLLQGIYNKYGLVADASVLASKNYGALSEAAETLNTKFAKQVTAASAGAAAFDLVGGTLIKAGTSSGSFTKAMDDMQRQVLALATGLGPAGVLLSSFGPWGFAAAAGIGLVVAAFDSLEKGADDLAKRATGLQAFSSATGLSTDQIQGLNEAGARFGLTSNTIAQGVERFTASIGDAQRGTGTLFDALLKINPQLALQVSGAQSVAQAFDMVAKAYQSTAQSGNTAGAASIARAAFGRGGSAAGPALLGASANAGGIQALGDEGKAAGGTISNDLIKTLQNLQTQLDQTRQRTATLNESMYSETVLRAQLQYAQQMERIAQAAHDFFTAQAGQSWSDIFLQASMQAQAPYPISGPPTPDQVAKGKLAQGLSTGVDPSTLESWADFDSKLTASGKAENDVTGSSAALYAIQQKLLGVLAGTATPAQQLQLQILGLKKAVDEHALSADQAAHAQSLLVESFNAQQIQQNVAAMGALAPPTAQYAAQVAALKLRLDEGKISQDAFTVGLQAASLALAQNVEATREQYGIASQADIAGTKYADMAAQLTKIGASTSDWATAQAVVAKAIQDTADRMAVLRSSTPNFQQLINDLQNANKTKDELLTSTGNALLQAAPAFTQALEQGLTISQAISQSLLQAASSIANAFATAGAKSIAGSVTNIASGLANGGDLTSLLGGAASGILGGVASFGIGTILSGIVGFFTQQKVSEEDIPPGIHKLIKYLSRPWRSDLESFNYRLIASLGEASEYRDRCIYSMEKPDPGSQDSDIMTLNFDWQRLFSSGTAISDSMLDDVIRPAQKAALSHFEELAEGSQFDEDIIRDSVTA